VAGTILAKLSSTAQADNTTITAANSGFSSVSIGAGNTAVHLAAARMAELEGYRFTQGGANQNFAYLDLGAAQSIFAWRIPFRYAATPTATSAFLRVYPATDHITNLWTANFTTTNRIQVVEGSGTLNVTSASGTPLVPGSDYVSLGLFNASTGAFELRVYPRANTTALFTLTGTASAPQAVQSIRFGIGTASSLTQLDTNDAFAIGSGDFLARTDIAATPLSVSPSVAPGSGPPSTSFVFAANPSGGNGNTITYAWTFGDGSTGTGATPSHTYAAVGSYTASVTATQA
jgi:hypothetical protein